MAESQDLISHSSLCNICCDVDFHGMFTGRDYRDYADGFSRYRADLDYGRQVPRTWEHIKMNAKCCSFCMLTFHQIQTFRLVTRNPNCLRVPDLSQM